MSAELNYPYLLAVHTICIDGQLHQNELRFLQCLAHSVGIDSATEAAAESILAQADEHLDLETVLQRVDPDQRHRALSLAALASRYDGSLDRTEQRLLERIKQDWNIGDDLYRQMQELAQKEAERLIAEVKQASRDELSKGAKVLSGLEAVLGQGVVDRVVGALGATSLKEKIQDYRIEALLSGPQYDRVIEECREVGIRDIKVADSCLHATAEALREIGRELDEKIAEIKTRIGDKPAQAAREALKTMREDRAQIEHLIDQELHELQELQIKKRRAMNFYSIAFMGRSKAGKSTLHAVVTGGGWDQIGVGRQNTTRLNRVYEWHNIRIIDTPGIATPGGEELEKVAESIIDEADLICFVVTNNNQQTSEFEFLKQLRSKGKPLLVLLNVKEDLSHPVRLKRFLAQPDQAFSDDKDRLGGHIDRIRRDAGQHYGTTDFPIIPVQLLAAQIAQQQPDHEHASTLMKASRLQHFLDSVRLSLLDEGLLRRSQNLLGSTVADIEHPCNDLKTRSAFYLDFAKQICERSDQSIQRLEKAQEDHARQLEQDIRATFAGILRQVSEFAEDHWDDSESSLNSAWAEEIDRFGLETKIQNAQERAIDAFSADVTDLLDEVGREISLNRRLGINTESLAEQDSGTLLSQTFKWSSSLASVVMGVAVLNGWNPGGWILAGVGAAIAIVGFLGSLFESKASKRRKAVANISQALESQLEKQEKRIVEAALKHFREQSSAGAAAVREYFLHSADGLAFVGQALARGSAMLQEQSSTLNNHFAARILDFAGKAPSESSAQMLRSQIREVRRKIGQSIDITISPQARIPNDLELIESIIQEKIVLQKAGV